MLKKPLKEGKNNKKKERKPEEADASVDDEDEKSEGKGSGKDGKEDWLDRPARKPSSKPEESDDDDDIEKPTSKKEGKGGAGDGKEDISYRPERKKPSIEDGKGGGKDECDEDEPVKQKKRSRKLKNLTMTKKNQQKKAEEKAERKIFLLKESKNQAVNKAFSTKPFSTIANESFEIITLFPQAFPGTLNLSIIGRKRQAMDLKNMIFDNME
jgi:hypothetical protein